MGKIKDFFKDKLKFSKIREKVQKIKDKRLEKKQLQTQSDEMLDLTTKIKKHKKLIFSRWGIIIGVIALLIIGYSIYNYVRVFHSYATLSSEKRSDITATQYAQLGGNLLKYSPDGVSCVSSGNEVLFSATFSMQSPIIDICGTTAVVGDQKGTQIYIFDENGQIGSFETSMPILKVKVANQGVVAAVLEEGDTTWINFYDTKGNPIAENRTSVNDFGYPMDIALAPDGLKMMVSYLNVAKEKMSTKIAFYNFDSVGQTQINNEVSSVTYDNTIVPKTLFMNDTTSVAFRNDGFTIFKGSQVPQESVKIDLEEEIVSIFYSDSNIGIVVGSDDPDHKYLMRLYNLSGRKTMQKYFDLDYKQIKIDGDEIIMFNEGKFAIYSIGGKEKFSGSYRKPIINIMSARGFRKYTMITQNSTDQIRLK